jgi:hypothetical protein
VPAAGDGESLLILSPAGAGLFHRGAGREKIRPRSF